MSNNAALQMELDQLRDERPQLLEKIKSSKNGRRNGLWAIAIGILTTPLGIGFILLIIGILAAITQAAKLAKANSDLHGVDQRIAELRQQIAAL
jgi:uncharacterized membrane protein YfcA